MRSLLPSPTLNADAAAPPHGRRRSPQPSSSPSSAVLVPVPPPSPLRPSSGAVPFSWEHRPGIPKTSSHASRPTYPFLPLPPQRRRPCSPSDAAFPRARKGRSPSGHGAGPSRSSDPFAAALAECAKEPETDVDELFRRDAATAAGRRRRSAPPAAAWSIPERFGGVMGIYGSCKATCSVSESTVRVPRSRIPIGAYDILSCPVRR